MANIKNIFNSAAKNTGLFYSTFADPDPGGTYGTGGIFYPSDKYPEGPPKSVPEKIWDAVKGAAKDMSDGYGKNMQAYESYLNTLNYIKKSGQFSLARGRVSTAPVSSKAGEVGGVKRSSFENNLDKWNDRFRKFAVRSYYESLTRGK